MRKIKHILFFLSFLTSVAAQNYHFQEGFATTAPTGWVRNCGTTTGLNRGGFTGANALKFDPTTFGETSQIETPAVNKAGTFTFYASRNANAVYYDLHVYKIVNGVSTRIETIPHTSIAKKPDWTEIKVAVNDASNNIKLKIWAEDKGASTSFLALDDFSLTSDVDSRLLVTKSSIAENQVVFYNLTKELVLQFNKEVEKGSGNIIINSQEVSISNSIIEGQKVTIPLNLTSNKGSNKSYTLSVPAGVFVEKNSPSTPNAGFTLNFETFKKANVPAHYAEIIDVQYSDVSPEMCRLDFYYPTNTTEPTPLLINMHGGGWSSGRKEEQTSFTAFTNMGFAVANVEYRMTPQAKAPAAVEDVRCAMQYVLKHAQSLNIDPRKIVFQGGSAGAHLALVAGYLQNDRRYDTNCNDYQGVIKVMAVINKYGPSDMWTIRGVASAADWLGSRNNEEAFVKSVSPVHMVNANTPPTYTVHGTNDMTVPKSVSSDVLVPKLAENRVIHQYTIIQGGGHGGFTTAQNTQINNEITAFIQPLIQAVNSSPNSLNKTHPDNSRIKVSSVNSTLFSAVSGKMTVFSVAGQQLNSFQIRNSINTNLSKGVYIVKLDAIDGQEYINKICIN
jgi:acetyl esterase/lipase